MLFERKIPAYLIDSENVGSTWVDLLQTDEKYKDYILSEIRANYGHMLELGATSAWETKIGAEDFGKAGSLCHGWSAIPIYYYRKLGMVNN